MNNVPAIAINQEIVDLEIIKVQPAEIEFNYEQIKENLTQYMEMYKGLIIQETDLDFIKKDLAKLNKLKKAIDDFRKITKADASANIKTFEDKCKELVSTIDVAYIDIKTQVDEFEERRREEKLQEVNQLIALAREESGLPAEYQIRIELKSEYLNKTMTDKKIMKDLEMTVQTLKAEYTIEQQKKAQIDTLCEVENQKHQLTIKLDPANYYHYEFEEAKELIEQAGIRAKEQQEEAIRRVEEQARIKAEKEAQAKIAEEARKLAQEQVQEAEAKVAEAQAETQSTLGLVGEMAAQINDFIPVEEAYEASRERIMLNLHVTESQKQALFKYLDANDFTYERYA